MGEALHRRRSFPSPPTIQIEGAASIALPPSACRPTLYLDDRDGRDQVAAVARGGWSAFERPLPAVLHACARRFAGLTVDVGANTGFYALLGALSAPGVRVLAFEPDRASYERLRGNIALNGLGGRISPQCIALSDRRGVTTLYVPTQEHGLVETSASLEATFKDAHSEARQVPVTTLDAALGGWRHRLSRVALIKVDVEGHEAAVLRGADRIVRRWRPILFVEVLPRADCGALTRFLSTHRYVDVALRADGAAEPRTAVRFDPAAWNHGFVPAEKCRSFMALLDADGLRGSGPPA